MWSPGQNSSTYRSVSATNPHLKFNKYVSFFQYNFIFDLLWKLDIELISTENQNCFLVTKQDIRLSSFALKKNCNCNFGDNIFDLTNSNLLYFYTLIKVSNILFLFLFVYFCSFLSNLYQFSLKLNSCEVSFKLFFLLRMENLRTKILKIMKKIFLNFLNW